VIFSLDDEIISASRRPLSCAQYDRIFPASTGRIEVIPVLNWQKSASKEKAAPRKSRAEYFGLGLLFFGPQGGKSAWSARERFVRCTS